MTRTDDLLRELARLEAFFANRVAVVRTIVNADGQVVGRIVRGSFQRDSPSEPPKKGTP